MEEKRVPCSLHRSMRCGSRTWVMGGSRVARGNSSDVAEFNFHADPEAAAAVCAAYARVGAVLDLVTWETTEHVRAARGRLRCLRC